MKNHHKPNHRARRALRTRLAAGAAVLFVGAAFAVGYTFGLIGTVPEDSAVAANDSAAHPGATGRSEPSLSKLLPRLEAKVAADPRNVEQRLLLAQTYSELGDRTKGVDMLRALHRESPRNMQVHITLAAALMEGDSQGELHEAYRLFDSAMQARPNVGPMARLYQGDILMRLGDAQGAVRVWKDYLERLPADDVRRAMFEEKIAHARAG